MGGEQTVMEALDHRHRQYNKTILMRLESPYQIIRDRPDQRRLLLNIPSNFLNLFVT